MHIITLKMCWMLNGGILSGRPIASARLFIQLGVGLKHPSRDREFLLWTQTNRARGIQVENDECTPRNLVTRLAVHSR